MTPEQVLETLYADPDRHAAGRLTQEELYVAMTRATKRLALLEVSRP